MFFFGGHTWRGESGNTYKFRCVLTNSGLPAPNIGGVYIFVRRRFAFILEVLYVGKAHELRSRLMEHEKWPRAYWYYGATERYVHGPIATEEERRAVEADLIHGLKPRMNDMEIPHANITRRADLNDLRKRFGFNWFQRRSTAAESA